MVVLMVLMVMMVDCCGGTCCWRGRQLLFLVARVRASDSRYIVYNVDVIVNGLVPSRGNWCAYRCCSTLPGQKRPLLSYVHIWWNRRLLLIRIIIRCTVRVVRFVGLRVVKAGRAALLTFGEPVGGRAQILLVLLFSLLGDGSGIIFLSLAGFDYSTSSHCRMHGSMPCAGVTGDSCASARVWMLLVLDQVLPRCDTCRCHCVSHSGHGMVLHIQTW